MLVKSVIQNPTPLKCVFERVPTRTFCAGEPTRPRSIEPFAEMSQLNRGLQILVPDLIHHRGSYHRQHLPAKRDGGLSFLHRHQHQHAMLLLRRSDAPLFIERRRILVGRPERLDRSRRSPRPFPRRSSVQGPGRRNGCALSNPHRSPEHGRSHTLAVPATGAWADRREPPGRRPSTEDEAEDHRDADEFLVIAARL